MNNQTLGAIMIVKNEEKNLGGILSDIGDVVDEICIVDTGSTDNTIKIAESFGARIGHFPWMNDFSAARNHSIELADSDYLLWLDADDRIDEEDRKALAALKRNLRHQKDRAYMPKVVSSSKNAPDSVSYQTRIFPNMKEVHFEGKVHEQLLPSLRRSGIKLQNVDITIRHTGYHDPRIQTAKAVRNLNILMEELKDGKDTANQHFLIAMCFIVLKEYERCLAHITRARQKRTAEDWHHFSFVISTECLLNLKRIEDALREVERGISIFPDSPLLYYYRGSVYMQAELFGEAAEAFGKAASLPSRIDAYPVPTDLNATNLLMYGKALEKAGRPGEAIEIYKRALKSGKQQKTLNHALGIALLQAGNIDDALLHLDKARELSTVVDLALWESLVQIHLFRKNYDRAHALYLEILHSAPTHLNALAGILDTSIELDDIDTFLRALEKMLIALNIPLPEAEIESLAECAELCMETAACFKRDGQKNLAKGLAETAIRLDSSCANAHLFLADLFAEERDTQRTLACLETALRSGIERKEIIKRIDIIEHAGSSGS